MKNSIKYINFSPIRVIHEVISNIKILKPEGNYELDYNKIKVSIIKENETENN